MRKALLSFSLLAVLCAAACKKSVDNTTSEKQYVLELPDSVEKYYQYEQVFKQNDKANLGRVLFYDKHLSLNNAVSCGSCHKQVVAFADNARFSNGFDNRQTSRNSLPIQNLIVNINGRTISAQPNQSQSGMSFLFWDGREVILQNLVARPITNHLEMGITDLKELEEKLSEVPYYKELFLKAYLDEEITIARVSECVALFMTSISANNTKFDRVTKTGTEQFTAKEELGRNLFNTKYQCSNCHVLTGGSYMGSVIADIGLDEVYTDKGQGALSSGGGDGMFRAPNLRNIALTAPYMHDGRFETLHDVLEHYSTGIKNSKNLTWELKDTNGLARKMNITEPEKDALVAFLNTLTDHEMVTDPKFSDPFIYK